MDKFDTCKHKLPETEREKRYCCGTKMMKGFACEKFPNRFPLIAAHCVNCSQYEKNEPATP